MAGGDVPARPQYLGSDRLDDVARMLLELTSQLWLLKDRTLVLEHLLAEHGVLDPGEVDAHRPAAELAATLRREREALTAQVLGAVLPSDDRVAAALRR